MTPEAAGELVVSPRKTREELWHALRGLEPPNKRFDSSRAKHPGGTDTKSEGRSEPNGDDLQRDARARTPLPPQS